MKELGLVKPFLFENNLILSLSSRWIEVIGQIPTFHVFIDKSGRLVIQSKEIVNGSGVNNNDVE